MNLCKYYYLMTPANYSEDVIQRATLLTNIVIHKTLLNSIQKRKVKNAGNLFY
jgi:hypothetical protein